MLCTVVHYALCYVYMYFTTLKIFVNINFINNILEFRALVCTTNVLLPDWNRLAQHPAIAAVLQLGNVHVV